MILHMSFHSRELCFIEFNFNELIFMKAKIFLISAETNSSGVILYFEHYPKSTLRCWYENLISCSMVESISCENRPLV